MDTFHNTLLDWPHEAPTYATHTLADADFILNLELGPQIWWESWQAQRLAELLEWVAQKDFASLPILRREGFRVQFAMHPARSPTEHGALEQIHSSGSSGVPVAFWRSELAARINFSHYLADHRRQSRDLHAKLAVIADMQSVHPDNHSPLAGDPWVYPGLQLARGAAQFTALEHAQWVCAEAPTYLATTPTSLSNILTLMELNKLQAPQIEQVMTSSGRVRPELRVRARRLLGASIRDRYACDELGAIAFQCPESDDHYHVAVANTIVEVVNPQGQSASDGVCGDILVTGLHQWASPVLRYETGDTAALHPHCPACGVSVPTLSQLMGQMP